VVERAAQPIIPRVVQKRDVLDISVGCEFDCCCVVFSTFARKSNEIHRMQVCVGTLSDEINAIRSCAENERHVQCGVEIWADA
jgi:hypothetical protein